MIDKQSEFIEHLFSIISNDPTMPADLKISLLRLQLPIHKLSISDQHFISNPKHPARHILSLTKKVSILARNNTTIIKKTECILLELLNSSLNINSFSSTNHQLEKLCVVLQQGSQKKTHIDETHPSQLKKIISIKVKSCIHGHDIPAACQDLILKLWPMALLYLLKAHGENSKQWCNAINMYYELLDSIQSINSAAQHSRLKSSFMNIVRTNNNLLLLYNHNDTVETAIKALITHYNQILGNSKFAVNKHITEHDKAAIQKTSSLPPSVKPGVWCEIYIDDITPPRRLRLSLINQQTGTLMFVNRKGIKKLEKDAVEFSMELERGLSSVYKHDTLFTKPGARAQFKKIG